MYEFIIDLPPLSLNNAYTRTRYGARIKKKDTLEWESKLDTILRTYSNNIEEIKNKHRCSKTALILHYIFFLKNFYTKKGSVHQRSGDVDNMLKLPNDVIAKILEIDDSNFIGCRAYKLPAKKNYMLIKIEVVDLEDINDRKKFQTNYW